MLVLLCCVVLHVGVARICCSHEPKWQLVWSDEFTNGISSDWEFEMGNGLNGWGNNELQYYRRENAQVEGGKLVITAKREDYDGFKYTSARLKTQFDKSWKYGKIEAKMAIPSFRGVWVMFWMSGDNTNYVRWPSSGEIDFIEHRNTNNEKVRGTIHWSTPDGAHAHHNRESNTNGIDYHIYSVEWNSSIVKWFVNGNQYFEVKIQGGVNGKSAFRNKVFVILNMAIGGNWPGFDVADEAFPAKMYIDYVRVYQDASTSSPVGDTSLDGYYFVQNRHSELYLDVTDASNEDGAFLQQWSYSGNENQQFDFEHLENNVYKITNKKSGKSLDVYNFGTENGVRIQQWSYGGARNQQFTVQSVGDGYYKIIPRGSGKLVEVADFSKDAGGKIQQWSDNNQLSGQWKLIKSKSYSKLIQAESYFDSSKVQLEDTSDVGGGKNVKCDNEGAWMAYKDIDFPSSGNYRIEYRVASERAGGKLSLDLNAGSIVLGMLDVPSTGGWQKWTTISHTVNVDSGTYNLGIYVQRASWNINWIKITKIPEQSNLNQGRRNSKLIQAESYFSYSEVQLEDTLDVGGGKNVKCDKEGAWMAYKDIDFPSSGSYRVEYRVASERAGGKLSLDLNAGSIVLGMLDIPSTGGLQKWTTISHIVNVDLGTYNLGIYVQKASWNINWIRITKV
uniref:Clotting factor G alpha subunit n=1 Tax=Tachypleus tridentatus TaxID=6853 RepID=CFGA_TACTR|nr:RecName: Full=Clotting factor G alpha subunit; Flags: Precursor [Tachypleus tridentatus]BAA04044.1 clotting factor G alpha subunit precursor [Tachypleus tridentatus]